MKGVVNYEQGWEVNRNLVGGLYTWVRSVKVASEIGNAHSQGILGGIPDMEINAREAAWSVNFHLGRLPCLSTKARGIFGPRSSVSSSSQ